MSYQDLRGLLLAEVPDLGKPVTEDGHTELVKDDGWAKEYHHVEAGELVLVDQCDISYILRTHQQPCSSLSHFYQES